MTEEACNIANTPKNTGSNCNVALKATAMLFMVPKGLKILAADLVDFYTYLLEGVHATGRDRIYPVFGMNAPISVLTNNKENDVIETLPDGSTRLIRSGMYNRTFMTTEGGLCLGEALASFGNSGLSFIEVDIEGNVAMMKNADGSYSGFPVNLSYAPLPDLADFATSYKNAFNLNFSPKYYILKGKILTPDADLTTINGLLDAKITEAAAGTTTKLKIAVTEICGGTDLVDLIGADLADPTNFIVTKKSDGTVMVISAGAIVSGHIELTGTFVSGTTYTVTGAGADVLYGNDVVGYDLIQSVDITIP